MQKRAAELLHIKPTTLNEMIKRHDIRPRRKRARGGDRRRRRVGTTIDESDERRDDDRDDDVDPGRQLRTN